VRLDQENLFSFHAYFADQVLFSVIVGAFALGNAAPNLESIANARGAAFFVWEIIDRVSFRFD
jgi:arginine exporter protein ArgO